VREIQSLTALRGIAAIWIVLHHFWPQTSSATPFLISKGYLAVDLFFILSGVVLYLVYSDAIRLGQFDFKRFVLKRFSRLYPLHFVTLIIATLILVLGPKFGFVGRPVPYDFGQMVLLHITLLHAWGITETGGLNYPSWSLSAEAFAYTLFPLIAFATFKTRYTLAWSLLFLLSCMLFAQLFWPEAQRSFEDNLVFTRLENDLGALRIVPEFLLGLAIAKQTKLGLNSAIWLTGGIALISLGFGLDLDALIILGFAALIGTAVGADPKVPRILRHLGQLSYSIYMTHALVQIAGFKLIETLFHIEDGAVPIGFVIPLIGVTMLCAQAMHVWCERPARLWILSLSTTKSVPPKASRSFPM
jgi:peptidoglycan/LPS O-acetylase OafA/YrhL